MLNRWTLGVALLALAVPVRAKVILYSNITSSYPTDSTNVYEYSGNYFGTEFTTTAGGSLGSIVLGLTDNFTPLVTGQTAGLYTDSGGEPGTLLEGWTVSVPANPGGLVTLTSLLNPSIASGTTYFFVFNDPVNTYSVGWYQNDTSVLGGIWVGSTLTGLSQALGTMPSLGIQLTSPAAVPEPGTSALFGAGLLAVGAMFRRRGVLRGRESLNERS